MAISLRGPKHEGVQVAELCGRCERRCDHSRDEFRFAAVVESEPEDQAKAQKVKRMQGDKGIRQAAAEAKAPDTLYIECTLTKVALGFRFHLGQQWEVGYGCPGDSS